MGVGLPAASAGLHGAIRQCEDRLILRLPDLQWRFDTPGSRLPPADGGGIDLDGLSVSSDGDFQVNTVGAVIECESEPMASH